MTDRDTDRDAASRDDKGRSADGDRQPPSRNADNGAKVDGDRKAAKAPDKAPDEAGDRVEEQAEQEARKHRRPPVIAIGIVIVLLLIGGGLYYWITTRNLESTDDAYTDGRAITIAPQVSGVVISLDINDNQFVKKDQLLIRIDPRHFVNDRDQAEGALATAKAQYEGQQLGAAIARKNFPAQLEQAKAQLANAKANLIKAQADYERQRSLPKPATSQQEVDAATAALKQAEAQVALAEAQVDRKLAGTAADRRDRRTGRTVEGTGRAGPGAGSTRPTSICRGQW